MTEFMERARIREAQIRKLLEMIMLEVGTCQCEIPVDAETAKYCQCEEPRDCETAKVCQACGKPLKGVKDA